MQAGFDRIDEVGEAAVFDAVEYAEGVVVLDLVELTESEVRERSRPDGEPMTIIHSAPNHHLARGKIEENEDDVHDRDGRLVEVIDVGGDEFSDLVNEETEPDSADERGQVTRARAFGDGGRHDGYGHQQSAPENVCDVEGAAPDLGIARCRQICAGDQHGGDAREQEQFETSECRAVVTVRQRQRIPVLRRHCGTPRLR